MSDEDLITALRQNKLHIDCVHMELTQNTADSPRRFSGSVYIYQDDGIISFKMYVSQYENASRSQTLSLHFGGNPGTLYEEEQHFTLSFRSFDGEDWTASDVLPSVSWHIAGPLISARLYRINRIRKRDRWTPTRSHYLRLHFFQEFDLPYTDHIETTTDIQRTTSLKAVKLDLAVGRCYVRDNDGELTVAISANAPLPENFDMRVIEALTYVTASQALWRVAFEVNESNEILRLLSPRPRSEPPQLQRPIHRAGLSDRRMFWRLFSKYLEFSTRSSPKRGWHPTFMHIHNAIEASANSLDAWATGLCGAVEGPASMILLRMTSPI